MEFISQDHLLYSDPLECFVPEALDKYLCSGLEFTLHVPQCSQCLEYEALSLKFCTGFVFTAPICGP